jgi:hypothetical protein
MTEASALATGAGTTTWIKSSYSGGEGNECVEIIQVDSRVGIRDSKDLRRNGLTLSATAFAAFVNGVKAAE